MLRRLMSATLLLALAAPGLAGQDGPAADRIYIALYNIAYSDIPGFMEMRQTYGVPILDDLVEQGVINSHGIWMHHTGGEYTLRETYIGHEDTNFEAFLDAYLGRYASEHPDAFAEVNGMIRAHEDEIFNMDVVNLTPGDAPPTYLYEAKFQVPFGDVPEWTRLWQEHFVPVAEKAIEDGMVRGFVIQSHNTGGEYNWKFSWLFDEWDNFDEVEQAFFSALPLEHEVFGMFRAHRDEIWQQVPGN